MPQGNIILLKDEARKSISEGVEILDSVIAPTLSPRGREVGFFAPGDQAMSIHDGVEISRYVVTDNMPHYWAIRTIRQAAESQVSAVGDGTTVSILLTAEIYRQAMANIIAGAKPRSLVDDLIKNRDRVLEALKKHAKKVETAEDAVAIATVSAQDTFLGEEIGKIVYKMGMDGVVTTDESVTGETWVDFQEGCQFENGYISPAFVTDSVRMEATIENTKILITNKALNNINLLIPLLDQFTQKNFSNLVVIAQDVSDTALGAFIATTAMMRQTGKGMNLLAVRAPYAGRVQQDFLDDIAILTGGHVVTDEEGRGFDTVKFEELGSADRVTATEKATMIVGGKGDKQAIKKRCDMLKDMKARKLGKSDYENEKVRERLAKLSTGIAVVKVGAPLEIEQKNMLERAKDAVKATTVSLEDGYVPGGETMYLTLRNVLDDTLAGRILYRAFERPFHVLLTNAGYKPDKWIDDIKDGMGIDVLDGKHKDMIKAGIIDPTQVVGMSILNAISSAVFLFTTETLILPKPKEDNK